jgi:signal peptidase II
MTLKPNSTSLTMIALAGLLADQASKWAILLLLRDADPAFITVLPFMDFVLVWNSGISYGLMADHSQLVRGGLIALSLLIIGFLLHLQRREPQPWLRIGYALIIGGALGNVLDRFVHGAVVDFISLYGFGYSWYVFNLADVWITLGGALVVWFSLKGDETKQG